MQETRLGTMGAPAPTTAAQDRGPSPLETVLDRLTGYNQRLAEAGLQVANALDRIVGPEPQTPEQDYKAVQGEDISSAVNKITTQLDCQHIALQRLEDAVRRLMALG